jgi:CheY-like chemotaxis protein
MAPSRIDARVNSQPSPSGLRVKPRILVADDDAEMRALLTLVLQNDGYEVITCADGTHLVEYLEALWGPPSPVDIDLMICDMRMPGLTGLEVLERLGRRPGFPPMILMTAFGDPHIHQRARQLGVYASLDKPFEVDQLLDLVHARLSDAPPAH